MKQLNIIATTRFEGGAEKYISVLAENLEDAGIDVQLLGDLKTWPDRLPQTSLGAGPKWSLRTLPVGVLRIFGELLRLKRITHLQGEGVVYNAHFKREQIAYSKLLSSRGRVVWTEHGRFPGGLFGRLIRPFYRRASRSASAIVCVSEIVARDIRRFAADPSVVMVVDTAIDLNAYSPASDEQRRDAKASFGLDSRPVALYVGRLEPNKRPELAIRGGLAAGLQVLVAGSGSQEAYLRNTFRGNDDVHFIGQVNDVTSVFAATNVHIFASTGAGEGFPTVILEASAMGVPTVAAAEAGFDYAVKAAGGLDFEGTVTSLSDALTAALLSESDRGRKAREWAETRDQSIWTSQYLNVLFADSVLPRG